MFINSLFCYTHVIDIFKTMNYCFWRCLYNKNDIENRSSRHPEFLKMKRDPCLRDLVLVFIFQSRNDRPFFPLLGMFTVISLVINAFFFKIYCLLSFSFSFFMLYRKFLSSYTGQESLFVYYKKNWSFLKEEMILGASGQFFLRRPLCGQRLLGNLAVCCRGSYSRVPSTG